MLPFKFTDNPYFNAPLLRPLITNKGVKLFEVAEPWIVKVDDKHWLEIPSGTLTNYGSVPWWVRMFISQTDPAIAIPSIIHDYLVEEFKFQTPLIYGFGADGQVVSSPIFNNLDNDERYIAADKLFKKYVDSFEGRTNGIKGTISYMSLRFYGKLRGL